MFSTANLQVFIQIQIQIEIVLHKTVEFMYEFSSLNNA